MLGLGAWVDIEDWLCVMLNVNVTCQTDALMMTRRFVRLPCAAASRCTCVCLPQRKLLHFFALQPCPSVPQVIGALIDLEIGSDRSRFTLSFIISL